MGDLLREIIKLQDDYIQFLSDEIGKTATFLSVHGQETSIETYLEGKSYRDRILQLKNMMHGKEISSCHAPATCKPGDPGKEKTSDEANQ